MRSAPSQVDHSAVAEAARTRSLAESTQRCLLHVDARASVLSGLGADWLGLTSTMSYACNRVAVRDRSLRQLQFEEESMKRQHVWTIALLAGLASAAGAQQFVYPAKGQTPEQQKSDEAACYTWAVQQSGFDPAKPPPAAAAAPPPTTATGTTPGAGARGAARGAVVGEIVADDPGAGAAVGAVAARGQSRRQNQATAQQAQQQQQAATQQQQAAFGKARAACLEGKGYTVK
jgi:hypothetical protein